MKKLLTLLLLFLCPFATCFAEQFSAEGVSLEVPRGFSGPISQTMDTAMVYGFTKPSSAAGTKTLLQLSAYEMGKPVPKLSKEEMWVGSDKYLLDFLKGVERRRILFSQGEIVHISLGGIPASKISWSGILDGLEANGVMYCVIVGSKIISLHTQDIGDEITPSMSQVIKAIESLTVTQKN